jgi:hypothetical protein
MERGRNQVETSTATPKIVLLFEERCLDNKRSFRNDQGLWMLRRSNSGSTAEVMRLSEGWGCRYLRTR